MVDVDKAIRNAVDSGKVEFGTHSGRRAGGKAKIAVISSNCSVASRAVVEKMGVPVYTYSGTSIELGAICGKPFTVSVLTVLDAGTSSIMELAEKK